MPSDDTFTAWCYQTPDGMEWTWCCGEERVVGFPTLVEALEDAVARLGVQGDDGR